MLYCSKYHGICSSLTCDLSCLMSLESVRKLGSWSILALDELKPLVATCQSSASISLISEARQTNAHTDSLAEKVRASCKDGQLQEALHLITRMYGQGIMASHDTFVSLLKGCGNLKALMEGKQVHVHMVNHGIESDVLLGNLLVSMYIKCGSLVDASRFFDKMLARDVFTWTLLIAAYARFGNNEQALKLFWRMEHEGVKPNKVTFLSILKACTSLIHVKVIHACTVQGGFGCDDFVSSTLLDMYAKCGSIDDAHALFRKLPKHGVVPWNTMIAGYAQHELNDQAFALFWQMQNEGVEPDEVTYLNVLKACIGQGCLEEGQKVHAFIIQHEMESNTFVANTLVDMYVKYPSMADALHVFNSLSKRDVVSWSVMIAGHAQNGHGNEALYLFEQMQLSSIKPNKVTYMSALKACASLPSLKKGQQIHMDIVLNQYDPDTFLGSSLIDMYSKCGSIEDAHLVFVHMSQQDVVAWNSIINGYTETGHSQEALKLFWHMQCDRITPDEATFVSTLKACVNLVDVEQGRRVHSHAIETSMHSHAQVGNTLVEMYAKCGCMMDARQVFDKMLERPMFVWTVAIAGYIENDLDKEGLQLFDQMKQEGVTPSEVTFSTISKACASPFGLEEGKQIHIPIIQLNFDSDAHVGNSLVDMYAKCGSITHARQVFDRMPQRDAVSYNAIISGYVHNGLCNEAVNIFWQMQGEDVKADLITFICVFKACACLADLEQGMQLHALAIEAGHDTDDVLRGVLVDMYAKCGSIVHAERVFNGILEQDAVSWTSMVWGYAQHGCGKEALQLLEQMRRSSVELDEITFIGVLSACSYAGLVDEGLCCFYLMNQGHGITPSSQHYACVVDLLGRAGCLDYAEDLLKGIPFQPAAVVWTALLGACKLHGDVELANYSVECIFGLEPGNAAASVLLSNTKAVFDTRGTVD